MTSFGATPTNPHSHERSFQMKGSMPRDAPTSLCAIPGYSGHIPGKEPENVIGSTFMKASELASSKRPCLSKSWANLALEPEVKPTLHKSRSWRSEQFGMNDPAYTHTITVGTKPRTLDLQGAEIPGYDGFIPGKYSEGVYGTTANITNKRSQARRMDPTYSPRKEACGAISQTAPSFWLTGADSKTIRHSCVALRREPLRSDMLPLFTQKERYHAQHGALHETMGHGGRNRAPTSRSPAWNRPRRRLCQESEITYQPPDPPRTGRVSPADVAKVKGAAGEPSYTMVSDMLRVKQHFNNIYWGGGRV